MSTVFVVHVLVVGLVGCAGGKPLPGLLRDARSGNGYASACPGSNEAEKQAIAKSPPAVSPELNQRLADRFPPGSNDSDLIAGLVSQGFEMDGSCKDDPSIHIATFVRAGSWPEPLQTRSQVFWTSDEKGRLLWTKGFVTYVGP